MIACGNANTVVVNSCIAPCLAKTDSREKYECARLCGKTFSEENCKCSSAALQPTLVVVVGAVLAWLSKSGR